MTSSPHNQVLIAFNNMTVKEKSTYKIDHTSFLGRIIHSIKKIEENRLSQLDVAYINLQNVIDKHPNAVHNRKLPHLQKEFNNAKEKYNNLLKSSRK